MRHHCSSYHSEDGSKPFKIYPALTYIKCISVFSPRESSLFKSSCKCAENVSRLFFLIKLNRSLNYCRASSNIVLLSKYSRIWDAKHSFNLASIHRPSIYLLLIFVENHSEIHSLHQLLCISLFALFSSYTYTFN